MVHLLPQLMCSLLLKDLSFKFYSVALEIWQHGAKENYCNVAFFNKIVDSKGDKNIKPWLENESKPIIII